jgi:hypothetical protein
MYVSGEGALLGIGFILRNVVLTFIPMGRMKHEKYADYHARKTGQMKKRKLSPILVTGLVFLVTGMILTVIWYAKYYNV